jgi:fatty-acyl-CoA synthase
MQEVPLNLALVLRRVRRLFPHKRVRTGGPAGAVHTWGEVGERAARLAGVLARLGVAPGDRVGSFAWNSHRHLELYFGVPCSGAVLHTVNVRLFADQVAQLITAAGDRVVFVDASLTGVLAPLRGRLPSVETFVVLDDGGEVAPEFAGDPDYETLLAAAPVADLPDVPESTAALLCYTSGTTGQPKGVLYSHRSEVLHALAALLADSFAISQADTVFPIAPMFHANGWGLPYAAALAGADLVLAGADHSPEALADLLAAERVTFAAGVPTIWTSLEEVLDRRPPLPDLRAVLVGGAPLTRGLFDRYAARGIPLLQGWGMTEVSPNGTLSRDPSSAGAPVPCVELRLTDPAGEELPWDGEAVGEVEVRGPWVARGYYGADAADRFAEGWLRTGDVGTIDPRGRLRITDRTKDLVKSGGEWISSVELEGHLAAHPDVREAAVVAVPHERWGERPLALVVRRPGAAVTAGELVDFLRPRVARWWLPDAVRFVDEIPKTSVGKFDKLALRAREQGAADPV